MSSLVRHMYQAVLSKVSYCYMLACGINIHVIRSHHLINVTTLCRLYSLSSILPPPLS